MTSTSKVFGAAALAVMLIGAGWLSAQSGKASKLTAADYSEIQELFGNYTQALDLGQPEALADTFTEDGELVGSKGPGQANAVRTPNHGRAELTKMEVGHGNFGSRHLTSDLVIKPTPTGVKATCYLVDIDVQSNPATLIETGVFAADVAKTPNGWKFKKLIVWRDTDDITPYKATKKQGGGGGAR